MEDLSTRNYDVNDIGEDDIRFVDCKKEAIFVQIICISITVLGVLLAYLLSPSLSELKSGAQLKTLFGYPLWVTVPTLLFLFESFCFIYIGAKVLKRPSLEAKSDEREEISA